MHQHQTRRHFVDKQNGSIPNSAIYCHFDFIHNIDVQYSTNSTNMWGDHESVSFMISYDRFRDENECIMEESTSYFCDDSKHDWSAALTYIEKHIKYRQQHFKTHYDRDISQFICYSDNGEFCCSAFIAKLGEIAQRLNVIINWNFTAAGHSKGKHDGEGHVVKTECRAAVSTDKILYDIEQEPYSVTIKNHMNRYFNNDNGKFAFTRKFFSIPEENISHHKSGDICKTLKGITKYHSFRIESAEKVYYRTLTCHCNCCANAKWDDCRSNQICGDWIRYDWKFVNNNSNTTIRHRKRRRTDNDCNTAKRVKYTYQYQPYNANNSNSPQPNFYMNCSMNSCNVQM